MAVVDNKTTEVGDVLIIKTNAPIIGLTALATFIDNTTDETGSRFFTKEFRYSTDGVNFSDYTTLSNANLAALTIISKNTFIIEYRYTRTGSTGTPDPVFNSVTVNGTYTTPQPGQGWKKMFEPWINYNDLCALNWSLNVLEKLYERGDLNEYLDRRKTNPSDDADFLHFWNTLTHFLGYLVCLARKLSVFFSDRDMLLEFGTQRGLFMCNDIDYPDLYYLVSHFYDEIRQRGTIQIAKQKGENIYSSPNVTKTKQVDGELLRTLCFQTYDEFIFNLRESKKTGFNIKNSSPLYRGAGKMINSDKSYEKTDNFSSLTKYPLINSSNCSIFTDGTKQVLKITAPASGQVAGIGLADFTKTIKFDQNTDYEITFSVRQPIAAANFTFGIQVYNLGNTEILSTDIKQLPSILSETNKFFQKRQLNRIDKYYYVRGILYNKNKYLEWNSTKTYSQGDVVSNSTFTQWFRAKRSVPINTLTSNTTYWLQLTAGLEPSLTPSPNLSFSNNLRASNKGVKFIPYIVLDNTSGAGGELYIWNLKISPLLTSYSTGFVQTNRFIDLWIKNRNQTFSSAQIDENLRRYLLPYNTVFKSNFLLVED